MITPDNVQTIISNNKIFSDTIQNFSTLPVRRVDCVAKVANSADPIEAIAELKAAIAGIPNAATNPAPDVEILSLARASGYPAENAAGAAQPLSRPRENANVERLYIWLQQISAIVEMPPTTASKCLF